MKPSFFLPVDPTDNAIRSNRVASAMMPSAVRDLADVLAQIAAQQLLPGQRKKEEKKDDS